MSKFASVILCAVLFCAVATSAVEYKTVYVGPFGSDSDSCGGTVNSACLSMSVAVRQVSNYGEILVQAGTMSTFASINKNITIKADCASLGSESCTPDKFVFDGKGQTDIVGFMFDQSITASLVGLGFHGWAESCMEPGCIFGIVDVSSRNTEITLQDCKFWGNNRAITARLGHLTLNSVVFENNSRGVVFQYSDFPSNNHISMNRVTFINCSTAIDVSKSMSILTATYLTISGGSLGLSITPTDGKGDFSGIIQNFQASNVKSRAIYMYDMSSGFSSTLRVTNAKITQCGDISSTPEGAALYIGDRVTFAGRDVVMDGNAAEQGAAVFCRGGGSVTLLDSTITNNSAKDGAAGWCDATCAFVISDSSVKDNHQDKNTGPCAGMPQKQQQQQKIRFKPTNKNVKRMKFGPKF